MFGESFLYRIEGFEPHGEGMGRWGFNVKLDINFARRAFQKEISEEIYENLGKIGEEIIRNIFPAYNFICPPYLHLRNNDGKPNPMKGNLTLLVGNLNVPGDACGLDVDYRDLEDLTKEETYEKYLTYSPHNMYNMKQAYALLSIFTRWVDAADAIFSSEDEKK